MVAQIIYFSIADSRAAQIMNIDVASGCSTDHKSLSGKLNPEKEPFFITDSLLLLRVMV